MGLGSYCIKHSRTKECIHRKRAVIAGLERAAIAPAAECLGTVNRGPVFAGSFDREFAAGVCHLRNIDPVFLIYEVDALAVI